VKFRPDDWRDVEDTAFIASVTAACLVILGWLVMIIAYGHIGWW